MAARREASPLGKYRTPWRVASSLATQRRPGKPLAPCWTASVICMRDALNIAAGTPQVLVLGGPRPLSSRKSRKRQELRTALPRCLMQPWLA